MTVFDRRASRLSAGWFVKVLALVGLFVGDQIEKANAPLQRRIPELERRRKIPNLPVRIHVRSNIPKRFGCF